MFRRICFAISACGMLFMLMPMSELLHIQDFVLFSVGFAFFMVGIFSAIESLYRQTVNK